MLGRFFRHAENGNAINCGNQRLHNLAFVPRNRDAPKPRAGEMLLDHALSFAKKQLDLNQFGGESAQSRGARPRERNAVRIFRYFRSNQPQNIYGRPGCFRGVALTGFIREQGFAVSLQ